MATDSHKSIRADEFLWNDEHIPDSHAYLAPAVLGRLESISSRDIGQPMKILDLGCGNGSFSARMLSCGYDVVACDHSLSGMEVARKGFPGIVFFQQDINEALPDMYRGKFDAVVSLEVIEHLFQPRALLARAREALDAGGSLIISTPYHGYVKNLALAIFNKFDDHWHPLRDFGHIKFFSRNTLSQCIEECGFQVCSFHRVGRIPLLAKSMVVVAEVAR